MFKAVEFDNTAQERIREAANLEKKLRLEALIGIDSEIGGIKIRQMTGFDVLQLQYAENNIITGATPDETDFAHFFLLLKSDKEKRNQGNLFKVILKKLKDPKFIEDVYTYVEHSFIDLPNVPTNNKQEKSYDANPSVWLTSIIDTLACEYGWTYEEIMSSPLSRTLQLYQHLLKRKIGAKYKIRNPLTQKASARELNKVRKQNG